MATTMTTTTTTTIATPTLEPTLVPGMTPICSSGRSSSDARSTMTASVGVFGDSASDDSGDEQPRRPDMFLCITVHEARGVGSENVGNP